MSHRFSGFGLIHIRLLVQQQGGAPGNKRRAERSSPSCGVRAKGIGCDDGFAGSSDPHNGIAIVGKRRLRIFVYPGHGSSGRDSHHHLLPLGGVNFEGRS